jgi:hypothetical protein
MSRARLLGWGCVALGVALSVLDFWLRPRAAAFAYLAAFGATFTSLLGVLALLAMTRTVGARWFTVLRGVAHAFASATLLLPLAFLPIALLLPTLYDWAGATHGLSVVAHETPRVAVFNHPWLGRAWFVARSLVYLGLWAGYAELMRALEQKQQRKNDDARARRQVSLSAAALPLLGFSGSWAAFDWLMSAVPGWNMTGLGLYVLTGGFASALGVLSVLVHVAKRRELLPTEVGAAHSLALGRLLFAAVCLWAYLAISQLIIVWVGNLPREAAFCLPRSQGPFRTIALVLLFGHFLLPFFLLLSRAWKKRIGFVAGLGGWLVPMHALDLYWLIAPSSQSGASVLDIGPFLLLGGLLSIIAQARFAPATAVPLHDPALARSLGYEST